MVPISWTTKTAKKRPKPGMARTHRTRVIPRRQVPDQTVTLADPLLVGLEQGELGVQQPAFDLGEPHGSQPRQTRNAEEVAELRRRFAGVELSVDADVDPVLHHRPDAHQEHSLAKNLLTDPLHPWPDVRGRQQVTAQEVGQDLRVDPIRTFSGCAKYTARSCRSSMSYITVQFRVASRTACALSRTGATKASTASTVFDTLPTLTTCPCSSMTVMCEYAL